VPTDPPRTVPDPTVEPGESIRARVREVLPIECRPDVLHRVQVWRVRREVPDREPVPLGPEECGDRSGAVDPEVVPDEDERPVSEVSVEVTEEPDTVRHADGTGTDGEEQPWSASPRRAGDGPDERSSPPPACRTDDGGDPSAGPRPADWRSIGYPALVEESDQGAGTEPLFWIRGQVTRTHRWIAASSRSRGTHSGFLQDQPIRRSTFQT